MLTDTFTAQAFFTDFQSDIPRALRWTTLRQDSGDPLAFVKLAKQEWEKVEQKAGLSEEDKGKRVKRVIFSDGLDVERAVALQKGCDDLGIGGELPAALWTQPWVGDDDEHQLTVDSGIWYRHIPDE